MENIELQISEMHKAHIGTFSKKNKSSKLGASKSSIMKKFKDNIISSFPKSMANQQQQFTGNLHKPSEEFSNIKQIKEEKDFENSIIDMMTMNHSSNNIRSKLILIEYILMITSLTSIFTAIQGYELYYDTPNKSGSDLVSADKLFLFFTFLFNTLSTIILSKLSI